MKKLWLKLWHCHLCLERFTTENACRAHIKRWHQ